MFVNNGDRERNKKLFDFNSKSEEDRQLKKEKLKKKKIRRKKMIACTIIFSDFGRTIIIFVDRTLL